MRGEVLEMKINDPQNILVAGTNFGYISIYGIVNK